MSFSTDHMYLSRQHEKAIRQQIFIFTDVGGRGGGSKNWSFFVNVTNVSPLCKLRLVDYQVFNYVNTIWQCKFVCRYIVAVSLYLITVHCFKMPKTRLRRATPSGTKQFDVINIIKEIFDVINIIKQIFDVFKADLLYLNQPKKNFRSALSSQSTPNMTNRKIWLPPICTCVRCTCYKRINRRQNSRKGREHIKEACSSSSGNVIHRANMGTSAKF